MVVSLCLMQCWNGTRLLGRQRPGAALTGSMGGDAAAADLFAEASVPTGRPLVTQTPCQTESVLSRLPNPRKVERTEMPPTDEWMKRLW